MKIIYTFNVIVNYHNLSSYYAYDSNYCSYVKLVIMIIVIMLIRISHETTDMRPVWPPLPADRRNEAMLAEVSVTTTASDSHNYRF